MAEPQMVECESCSAALPIPEKYWGLKIRCPECREPVDVPVEPPLKSPPSRSPSAVAEWEDVADVLEEPVATGFPVLEENFRPTGRESIFDACQGESLSSRGSSGRNWTALWTGLLLILGAIVVSLLFVCAGYYPPSIIGAMVVFGVLSLGKWFFGDK
ncbi:MAG: hypothetical protein R3C01_09915 [Planctomycetaceae bacterium]